MSETDNSHIGAAVRQRRKMLGLTQGEVAARTGLTAAFLSQMERGLCAPSFSSLMRIARSLDTSVEALVRINDSASPHIAAASRPRWGMGDVGRFYEQLGPGFAGAAFYPTIIHRPPGHVSERMQHPGEVFCYLLEGSLTYHLGEDVFHMNPGDTIHHDTRIPHHSVVTSAGESVELWVSSFPWNQKN